MSSKIFDAMKLHDLIRNICNGSTSVIVEDAAENMIDALHNFSLIRCEECNSLHKHLEASKRIF